jgi:hypothetical protein
VTTLRCEQPIAVELELEDPVVAREGVVARFGEHELHLAWIDA